jgi:hypothetical protein
VSRNPKSDGQDAGSAHEAQADQLWSVDTGDDAILVAQDLLANVDPNAFTADIPGVDAGVEVATQDYDSHVPLVLDGHELAGLDAALDFLTSSHDLFDVPTLDMPADISTGGDDASSS